MSFQILFINIYLGTWSKVFSALTADFSINAHSFSVRSLLQSIMVSFNEDQLKVKEKDYKVYQP